MEIEVVLDAGATIGESPTGRPPRARSIGSTSRSPRSIATSLSPEASGPGRCRATSVPSRLVSRLPGAVVALRIWISGSISQPGRLTHAGPAARLILTLFRFNEGACDAAGRFWVGVMFDPLDGSASAAEIISSQLHPARRRWESTCRMSQALRKWPELNTAKRTTPLSLNRLTF